MKTSEFNKLSKKQQRLLIAKDALKQLKSNVYDATSGSFVWLSLKNEPLSDEQVQEFLTPSNIKECKVCALGGLMVSAVRLKNSLVGEDMELDYPEDDGFGKVLRKVFSLKQRILIEAAFELGDGYYHSRSRYREIISDNLWQAAKTFGQQYRDESDRFKAILKNIIKNEGTFKP